VTAFAGSSVTSVTSFRLLVRSESRNSTGLQSTGLYPQVLGPSRTQGRWADSAKSRYIVSGQPSALDRFILDAKDAAARLDAVSIRHDRETISLVVKRGQDDYEALLRQRQGLPPPPNDDPVVNSLLDGIQARLKFLGKRIY